jgi:hypothetical protein
MQQILLLLFIAEVSYALVGLDLLRRASRTRGLPELFLGLAFVFNGLSYFFTDLPIITRNDALVSNRFLLIGIYGTLAFVTYPVFLWMYVEYERHGVWSDALSLTTGLVELVSLAALWISFSAPAFYRRWVGDIRANA